MQNIAKIEILAINKMALLIEIAINRKRLNINIRKI